MIKIREEQLAELALTMRDDRRAQLVRFFRGPLATQTAHLDDATLEERILTGERLAARFGVTTDKSISLFSVLCVLMGEGFAEMPAIKELFAMPGTPPDDKVLILLKLMKDRFAP